MLSIKMVMMVAGFFGMLLIIIGFDRKQSDTTNIRESGTAPIVIGTIMILIGLICFYILNKEKISLFFEYF